MSERDPSGTSPNTPGAKLDAGKAPIMRGAIQYFPRALAAVAGVSDFGARKYTWNGWESVPDGFARYSDAMARHLIGEAVDGPIDPETGLTHAAQVAWNALARLEMMLRSADARPAQALRIAADNDDPRMHLTLKDVGLRTETGGPAGAMGAVFDAIGGNG